MFGVEVRHVVGLVVVQGDVVRRAILAEAKVQTKELPSVNRQLLGVGVMCGRHRKVEW